MTTTATPTAPNNEGLDRLSVSGHGPTRCLVGRSSGDASAAILSPAGSAATSAARVSPAAPSGTSATPVAPTGCSGARAGDLDALLADLDLSDNERRYLQCYRYRLERIVTDLPDLNGRDVLDVGCNTGFMMALFRRVWPDVRPVGCDICRTYVAAARRRGFRALVCSLERSELPFAADSFDVVFAGELIEMLGSLDPLFNSVIRALRPGGRFFAQTLNLGCLSNRLNLLLNRPIFLKWSKRHDFNRWRRSYLRSELTDMLTHYGLIDVKIAEIAWWTPSPLRRLAGRALAAANRSLGAMFMIEATKPG